MSAETDLIYSSTHHTFVVGPWKAGPTAVMVTQIDDPECVVLILRDRDEVFRLANALWDVCCGPHPAPHVAPAARASGESGSETE